MIKIVFIKDFATKKAGEIWKCDGMLASQLISVDKVAKFYDEKEAEVKEQPKEEKPKKKAK